jgi:hypothetical protein
MTDGGLATDVASLLREGSGDCGAVAARFDLAQRTRTRFGADVTMVAFAAALSVIGEEAARADLSE